MKRGIDKVISFFNTETPVIGEVSKIILSNTRYTKAYADAVNQEKKGEPAILHVGEKAYRLVRAGAYHTKK